MLQLLLSSIVMQNIQIFDGGPVMFVTCSWNNSIGFLYVLNVMLSRSKDLLTMILRITFVKDVMRQQKFWILPSIKEILNYFYYVSLVWGSFENYKPCFLFFSLYNVGVIYFIYIAAVKCIYSYSYIYCYIQELTSKYTVLQVSSFICLNLLI